MSLTKKPTHTPNKQIFSSVSCKTCLSFELTTREIPAQRHVRFSVFFSKIPETAGPQSVRGNCLISRKSTWQLSCINVFTIALHNPKQAEESWPLAWTTFYNWNWCLMIITSQTHHCNYFEFTFYLMTSVFLNTARFQMSAPKIFLKLLKTLIVLQFYKSQCIVTSCQIYIRNVR